MTRFMAMLGDDLVEGGLGNDDVNGEAGNDTISGDTGRDVLNGGDGNDSVFGGTDVDAVGGGNGDDLIDGGDGDDSLAGDAGTDALHGGLGNDALNGGAGSDTFFFDTALSATSNVDSVEDFEAGIDNIALSEAVFSAIGPSLTKGEFHIGKNAHDGNDHIIYSAKSGRLSYDADGKGGDGKVLFATLDKQLDLHADDFTMVA